MNKSCNYYMNIALIQAKKAYDKLEVPVGAIIVKNDKIISRAYNLRETKKNSLAHAEIVAINKACKKLGTWRLDDCSIYVTLEPCPMCAGAIIQSRIKNVYYGATDKKNGAVTSILNMFDINTTHKVIYKGGCLEQECSTILTNFFSDLRKKKCK